MSGSLNVEQGPREASPGSATLLDSPAATGMSTRHAEQVVQSIKVLYELHKSGALSLEEFNAAKQQILFPPHSLLSVSGRSSEVGHAEYVRSRHIKKRENRGSKRGSSHWSSTSSSSSSISTVSNFMVAPRPRVWLPLVDEGSGDGVNHDAVMKEELDEGFLSGPVDKAGYYSLRSRTLSQDRGRPCAPPSSNGHGSNLKRYGTFRPPWPVVIGDTSIPKESVRAPMLPVNQVFVEYFNCRGERGQTFSSVELKEHQLRPPLFLHKRFATGQRERVPEALSTLAHTQELVPSESAVLHEEYPAAEPPGAPSVSGNSSLELCLNWYWVDMVGRDPSEVMYKNALRHLTKQFDIAESFLLDREHPLVLPQICSSPEDPSQFLICLRVATAKIALDDDSVKELTNRWILVVDLKRKVVITIHRMDSSYIANMRYHWKSLMERSDISFEEFLVRIMHDAVCTYTSHLIAHSDILEKCEAKLFVSSRRGTNNVPGTEYSASKQHAEGRIFSLFVDGSSSPFLLKLMDTKNKEPMDKGLMNIFLYHLHRRASVHHRVLNMTRVVLSESFTKLGLCSKEYADEMCVHCIELIDRALEICDDAKTLLDMHISLQSFRTNELMALLTKFSAFFTPSSFLAAVYGMNFPHIPELQWAWGYPCYWLACIVACVLIYLYMYRRGLLE
ncbi:cation transporter, putative [Trypanosoma brucei gambiense DAL972]|uniref:Cation transporter, putative n=2 Tax=Trypanosoma brucei TaxID=5691 RepID=C9ZXS3_TRYB9|nr:cation transporter, putative [Trypanosoma brucei gambiense DAL972]RHW70480.1 cation transporter [Trypanosoma brucei equiperdum]CBH14218.1 cation transporter, putative [Trypanosoma brucei gambiense DAL972]|eukprot:XP_011776488.1 cation transporter, putative [Trypanosoma brucei gambiense DAL972]